MKFGIHLSIAGSLESAAWKARQLRADAFQIFSSSPRMWRESTPAADDIAAMKTVMTRYSIGPLVIHDNYLINLASGDAVIREKSIAAFRGELQRAEMLGAAYLVAHPGSGKRLTPELGMTNIASGLAEATAGLGRLGVTLLLECTAGQGFTLGSRLEELRDIRMMASRGMALRIQFCLDTCHLSAAGYDVASAEGLERTVDEVESCLGLENVPVIHANDSKGALGSHLDRHTHIGKGQIGMEGFARILQHAAFQDKVFILETPVEREGDDRRNLAMLRRLAGQRSRLPLRS